MDSLSDKSEKMLALVEEFVSSGKSQKVFCQENHLKGSTFSYWVKKYRQQNNQQEGFIPIDITGPSYGRGDKPRVELSFSNGLTLRIY